jgi:hypothetical protein
MSVSSDGGVCAPMTASYDSLFGVHVDERCLQEAQERLWGWWQTPSDEESDQVYVFAAAEEVIRTYLTAQMRRPVRMSLPDFSVPRGGIRYLPQPVVAPWRLKLARIKGRVKRPIVRYRAFRQRVADTRDVWTGRKEAMSDEQREALCEW